MSGINYLASPQTINVPSALNLENIVDDGGNIVSGEEYVVNNDLVMIEAQSNSVVAALTAANTDIVNLETALSGLFEYESSDISADIPAIYNNAESSYTYPSGTYLNTDSVPLIDIGKIVDDANYVKMRIEERNFLGKIIAGSEESSFSKVTVQVNSNSPLNVPVQLISGNAISISQIAGTSATSIKIDSAIPYSYYHSSQYNVTPTKPDPANPYRYKVCAGPYTRGTLRVYVNTFRIPDRLIDETFAAMGEFMFVSTIPLSEIPDTADNDFIICDFDVPLLSSSLSTSSSGIPDQNIIDYQDLKGSYRAIRLKNSGFVVGDWLGFTDSGFVSADNAGILGKINVLPAGTGTCLNPLGVVAFVDGEDIVVANDGLVRMSVVSTLSVNPGKKYLVSKTIPGTVVPSSSSDSPQSGEGNYVVSVGTSVVHDGINFLWINIEKPYILS